MPSNIKSYVYDCARNGMGLQATWKAAQAEFYPLKVVGWNHVQRLFKVAKVEMGQERTLPDAAGSVTASKPYDPSIKPAADGSNACGECKIADREKISTDTGSVT